MEDFSQNVAPPLAARQPVRVDGEAQLASSRIEGGNDPTPLGETRNSPTIIEPGQLRTDLASSGTMRGRNQFSQQLPALRDAAPGGLVMPCPAQPMTYNQLTESGYGAKMPNVLWVPYIVEPSAGSREHISSSQQEALLASERLDSHKRQLSDRLEDLASKEKKTREIQGSQAADANKNRRPSLQSLVRDNYFTSCAGRCS